MLPDRYKSRCPSLAPILQPQRRKYVLGGVGILVVVLILVIVVLIVTSSEKETFVLDRTPLFAGRNNLPQSIYALTGGDLSKINLNDDLSKDPLFEKNCSHCNTDLVRLCKGQVSSQFWVARSSCEENNKITQTMEQVDLIHRMIKRYPYLKLVLTPKDLEEAFPNKKIASMIMIDGGQALDQKISLLRNYYRLGVRAMTLASGCDSVDYIDENGTFSEFGQEVVEEMNKLGMIIDVQGMDYESVNSVLNISKAPVLVSHSAAKGVFNASENLDDDTLKLLKNNKGLLLITFDDSFLGPDNVTKTTVIEHINYIVDKIGYDNIGIGGNFDSIYKKPVGLEDVSHFPDLFKELKATNKSKWSSDNMDKLAGLNFHRFFNDVETVKNETLLLEQRTD